jgi:hypothetical protein
LKKRAYYFSIVWLLFTGVLRFLLKGLSHEIETGLKLCCWIDCPRRRAAGGFWYCKMFLWLFIC